MTQLPATHPQQPGRRDNSGHHRDATTTLHPTTPENLNAGTWPTSRPTGLLHNTNGTRRFRPKPFRPTQATTQPPQYIDPQGPTRNELPPPSPDSGLHRASVSAPQICAPILPSRRGFMVSQQWQHSRSFATPNPFEVLAIADAQEDYCINKNFPCRRYGPPGQPVSNQRLLTR